MRRRILPKRFRPTRRVNLAMTEEAYRRLRKFSQEAGLDEGEALSFLFENWSSVTNDDSLGHRLGLFKAELDDRKR
jgi:hypothetical protein